jgi:hypothetical protein
MPDLTGIPALDLLIGLAFIYLLLSLLCSAIQETIAGVLKLRAKNLEKGLHNMLAGETDGDKLGEDALSKLIWANPLMKSLFKGTRKPSYVAPRTFALALLDTIAPDASKPTVGPPAPGKSIPTVTQKPPHDVIAELRQAVADNVPEPAKGALLPLIDEARGDIDRVRHNVEDWFDDVMARVSGWYKRQAQIILCVIALVVTIGLNADSLIMGETLWKNDAVRSAVVSAATAPSGAGTTPPADTKSLDTAAQNVSDVKKLGVPMGWNDAARDPRHLAGKYWPGKLLGWFLTFAALSLGAPFWFDALGRLARLRNSGKPEAPLPASGRGQANERVQPPPDRPAVT